MYFISWIIVGLIMGWLTRKLLKEGGYGQIVDLVACITGAVAGGFVGRVISFPGPGGLVYSTLVAILGAVVLRGVTGYARHIQTQVVRELSHKPVGAERRNRGPHKQAVTP
jgi:uncharacterized membrane protein YeaQ/YmgE (transglycosylase-associated protein family)